MRAGGLRHKVGFGPEKKPQEFERRADVQERQEQSFEAQGLSSADGIVKVRVRWDQDTNRIDHGWNMFWRGREHKVESAGDPFGRRREVLIVAVRRA